MVTAQDDAGRLIQTREKNVAAVSSWPAVAAQRKPGWTLHAQNTFGGSYADVLLWWRSSLLKQEIRPGPAFPVKCIPGIDTTWTWNGWNMTHIPTLRGPTALLSLLIIYQVYNSNINTWSQRPEAQRQQPQQLNVVPLRHYLPGIFFYPPSTASV